MEQKKKLKSFKDLLVWKKAYQLCLNIYKVTKDFPAEERYSLSSQIRRSASSIPSNIAEGYGRKNRKEYIQFLYIAYGSNCELETQLLLARDLNYIKDRKEEDVISQMREVGIMLKALIKSL